MAWTAPRTYVAGEVITAAIGNTHWRDNLKEVWREFGYDENTSPVAAIGTATTIVAGTARSYDGSVCRFDFFCPSAFPDGGGGASHTLQFDLYDSAVLVVNLAVVTNPSAVSDKIGVPVSGSARLTPTVASHTYGVKATSSVAGAASAAATSRLTTMC